MKLKDKIKIDKSIGKISLGISFVLIFQLVSSFSFAQVAKIPEQALEEMSLTQVETLEIDSSYDPCPKPERFNSETPNDLQTIQEDITRFTLCLQRAQLLNRLNELGKENDENIQSTLDEKIRRIVEQSQPQQMVMPNIPAPQIGNGTEMDDDMDNMDSDPVYQAPVIDWKIQDIKGVGNKLTAQLIDSNGNLAYVKKGEEIADSQLKVSDISASSVTVVNQGDVINTLQWSN
jgi:type IV pilus biogenesis protein PilP